MDHLLRYHRQMLLPEMGIEGQQRLSAARVLVIGAGGLGCPVLQYLAAAGVGTIGVADHDIVAITNLHRQVLYNMDDVGRPKADAACEKLQRLNPEIRMIAYPEKVETYNILDIIENYHIVVDGTDNFPSRYLINDACVLLDKPLVYGAVSQHEGQVAIFNIEDDDGLKVNYRNMFPEPPAAGEVANCAEAGVMGVLPGIIGTMQANEVIKLITGYGDVLMNKVLVYNSLTNNVYDMALQGGEYTGPPDEETFLNTDYNWFCGIEKPHPSEVDTHFFDMAIQSGEYTVIDVREDGELPYIENFDHLSLPLSYIKRKMPEIDSDRIILFCQTGKRSLEAREILAAQYPEKEIYSLKDGLVSWI